MSLLLGLYRLYRLYLYHHGPSPTATQDEGQSIGLVRDLLYHNGRIELVWTGV